MIRIIGLVLVILGLTFAQNLNESFSGTQFPPSGWSVYTLDDTLKWGRNTAAPYTTPGCTYCPNRQPTSIPNNDWLVTPRVYPTATSNQLKFYYRDYCGAGCSLEVWVSRAGNTPTDFLNVVNGFRLLAFTGTNTTYKSKTVSLSTFINQPIYIAFRYCGKISNRQGVYIDNVSGIAFLPGDVGVDTITSPDTAVPAGEIIPRAIVKNFGLDAVSFWTRCEIETISGARTVYRDSVWSNSLPSSQSGSLTFRAVTLNGGFFRIKVRTVLANDMQPSNDEKTRDFRIIPFGYTDASIPIIFDPTGEIQHNTVYYPSAAVKNYSYRTESVPAVIQIKNRATSSVVFADSAKFLLAPLAACIYTANPWTATVGLYQITSYSQLPGDQNPVNDTSFADAMCAEIDVGVVEITSPPALTEPRTNTPPAAIVKNFGWTTQTFNVTFKISDDYTDTKTVSLSAGDTTTVTFNLWNAVPGTFLTRCSTYLYKDMQSDNNTKEGVVFVPYIDVAPIEIILPAETIPPSPFEPRAYIRNYSNIPITSPVELSIYSQTKDIVCCDTQYLDILPTTVGMVTFRECTLEPGLYTIMVLTMLPSDLNSDNDTLSRICVVIAPYRDIAMLEITSPSDSIDIDYPVAPTVRVQNVGNVPLAFRVFAEIRYLDLGPIVYQCTSYVATPLPVGQMIRLNFPDQSLPSTGNYAISCKVDVIDDNPENDQLSNNFVVIKDALHDVGIFQIISPAETLPCGFVQSTVMIRNYGNTNESFEISLKIVKGGSTEPCYDQSIQVNDLAPRTSEFITFPAWPSDTGDFSVICSTGLREDMNPNNDTGINFINVYLPVIEGWVQNQDVPQLVKDGGALTYVPNIGIYAFPGNRTNSFLFYYANSNSWTTKTSLPDHIANARKTVGKGASLCNDGSSTIYAVRGNNTNEFWAYNIATDNWTQLQNVPLGINNKKLRGGSALGYLIKGDSNFVCLVKGSRTYEFWVYYVQSDTWLPRNDVPAGAKNKPVDIGSCISLDGYDNLYLLKSGVNELCRYDIGNNYWEVIDSLPRSIRAKKVKIGASLTCDNEDNLYAFKGGNTREFWSYALATNQWTAEPEIPLAIIPKKVNSGGAVVYAQDAIYAMKGNRTSEFWKYIPPTNSTNRVPTPNTEVTIQTRNNIELHNIRVQAKPNVVTRMLNINYQLNDIKPVILRFYDITGTLIKTETRPLSAKTGVLSVDVSEIATGVYYISFESGGAKLTLKIVIKR